MTAYKMNKYYDQIVTEDLYFLILSKTLNGVTSCCVVFSFDIYSNITDYSHLTTLYLTKDRSYDNKSQIKLLSWEWTPDNISLHKVEL